MKTANVILSVEEFKNLNPILNEGLIRTINVEKASRLLINRLRGQPCQLEKINKTITSLFVSFFHNRRDFVGDKFDTLEFNNILDFINNLGYVPSHYYSYGIDMFGVKKFDKKKVIELLNNKELGIYKIKFDGKFPPTIPDEELPNKVHHISDGSNKDKILKIGLSPKTQNKIENHSDRVYLCLNQKCLLSLVKTKRFYRKSTSSKIVIFEIDLNYVLTHFSIDFFRDPSLDDAIFTYSNISPKSIKVVQELNKPT